MDRKALKDHVLAFEDVDALWSHLYLAHRIEARGGMRELDRLHIEAHKREEA